LKTHVFSLLFGALAALGSILEASWSVLGPSWSRLGAADAVAGAAASDAACVGVPAAQKRSSMYLGLLRNALGSTSAV
jgi:hypothetical protein